MLIVALGVGGQVRKSTLGLRWNNIRKLGTLLEKDKSIPEISSVWKQYSKFLSTSVVSYGVKQFKDQRTEEVESKKYIYGLFESQFNKEYAHFC